jgi:hypothetical protein
MELYRRFGLSHVFEVQRGFALKHRRHCPRRCWRTSPDMPAPAGPNLRLKAFPRPIPGRASDPRSWAISDDDGLR